MKLNELIKNAANLAKIKITDLAQEKISNTEKKEKLDTAIYNYINKFIETVPLNFVFKFIIKKLLLENISDLTQVLFDLIKTRVGGVTK